MKTGVITCLVVLIFSCGQKNEQATDKEESGERRAESGEQKAENRK